MLYLHEVGNTNLPAEGTYLNTAMPATPMSTCAKAPAATIRAQIRAVQSCSMAGVGWQRSPQCSFPISHRELVYIPPLQRKIKAHVLEARNKEKNTTI